jgi:hypothetical protein
MRESGWLRSLVYNAHDRACWSFARQSYRAAPNGARGRRSRARPAGTELGVANADFIEGEVESFPFPDESFGCWRCRR